jgi:hypothetical protein
MSELEGADFFGNELYQYYIVTGQPRPEYIIAILKKSPLDLTEKERTFYQNAKESTKRELKERLKQTGASKDVWIAQLTTASQSIIGMLAAEMLASMDAPPGSTREARQGQPYGGPPPQPGPYVQPPYYPPPPKESKVWLWVTLSVVGGLMVLGLLVLFIALPVYNSAQSNAQAGACKDNLRTIDSAIMQYRAANNGAYPNGTSDLVGTYVRAPFPTCKSSNPAGVYTYSHAGTSSMRAVCPNGHTY